MNKQNDVSICNTMISFVIIRSNLLQFCDVDNILILFAGHNIVEQAGNFENSKSTGIVIGSRLTTTQNILSNYPELNNAIPQQCRPHSNASTRQTSWILIKSERSS